MKTNVNLQGYIAEKSIVKYVFKDSVRKIAYLILTNPSKLNAERELSVLKYDLTEKRVLSKVSHWYIEEYDIEVEKIKNTPLKNIRTLISIHEHGDFCGGGESTIFVADAGDKLVLFPDQYNSFSDGGDFFNETLFVPYKYKGQTLLLANNDEAKLAYPSEALLPYPTDTNVPIDGLLVVKTEKGEYQLDKDGEEIVDKGGRAKIKKLIKETTYYHWDGAQVNKVKTVIKKEK